MSLRGEDALILAYDYTEKSLEGTGALKGQDGKDGVSPIILVNTSTEDTYKLDITDKNGTITTPNLVGKQGLQGIQGEQGKPADNPIITENANNTEDVYKLDLTVGETVFTTKNIIGKQGLEGVSPSVTTNLDNTEEDYRLNITTKGGTFTTPNLRGPQGEQGPQGESAASAINPRGDYDVNADPHYTLSDYITSAEGNTYVCKKDNPNNAAPTDGTVNDEFWQVLALRGAKGESGKDGEKGSDGVTFTPSIDENGVLSFTNNGGLENPEPIDIKGDNGVTFTPSIDTDGYLSFTNNGNLENPEPIKVLGKDGEDGKDGIDGTTYIPSIGTVTTVESNADASAGVTVDEETKEAVFNFAIPKGENGADGFSPIVTVAETDNGHNVTIKDVNGVQNFEVLDGKDACFTSLSQLGLTADATFQDVVDALPKGGSALLGVKEFTNYQTIFPYEDGNDQFARVHIVKGVTDGSIMYARWFRKDGAKEAIASFNINDNKFDGWRPIFTNYYTSLAQLGLTAPTTIGEAFNAMPDKSQLMLNVNNSANADATVTDAPHNQGVLIINKHNNGRFGIEFNYSLGGNGNTIRKWIGTLKGSDGTGLNWKEVAYSNDHAMKSYSSLADLGLDTTATINNIISVMANGSMFVYKTDVFDLTQYENLQFATVTIIKQSANRVQAIMTDKDTGNLYVGRMDSTNKIIGWTKVATEEIVHTSLSGNLAGITTVLDLVNALLTEYRATSPKKPIRFVSGEFTKTTLTDLPVAYGLLQITVAGWDVIEVRLAHSANGFKTMYYGFVTRISGEESISSITWRMVETKAVADVGFTTINQTNGLIAPTGITMTDSSKVNYCIRNGICYVHIALQISSISAKVNSWTVIAELPKSVIEAVGAMNCEGNTITDCMPIRVSQAGKLTLMYKGATTSTSDWWGYSFSYPVAE